MGDALTVAGNVNAVTESNINQDPLAANEIFKSELDITMIRLNVTTQTLLNKKENTKWRQLKIKYFGK